MKLPPQCLILLVHRAAGQELQPLLQSRAPCWIAGCPQLLPGSAQVLHATRWALAARRRLELAPPAEQRAGPAQVSRLL
jgi:hypothetical protein